MENKCKYHFNYIIITKKYMSRSINKMILNSIITSFYDIDNNIE